MNRLLEAALSYAQRGWLVFPLHTPEGDGCSCENPECDRIGKHPRTKHGLKDATTDPRILKRWWELQWPDANIGIVTGSGSGLVVIDVDPDHGGSDSWYEAQREHQGCSVDTVEAITGSGGTHVLFRHPGGIRIGNRQEWLPGVDVRGDGGYIVAAPSLHASGACYEWEASCHPDDVSPAPLPEWLLDQLVNRRKTAEATGPKGVDQGQLALVDPVLAGCAWLRHCVDDAASLKEAPWHALATICAQLQDGQRLYHEWSKPFPRYDQAETQEKLDHARRTSRPRTCSAIRMELDGEPYCSGCPHWGKIRSPIALGRGFIAEADLLAPPPTQRIQVGLLEDVPLPDNVERRRPTPRASTAVPPPATRNGHPNGHANGNGRTQAHAPAAAPAPDEAEWGAPPLTEEALGHAAADANEGEGRGGPSELSLARGWAGEVREQWAFFEGAQWYRYARGCWRYSSAERAEAELQHWLERARLTGTKVSVTARKVSNILRLARNHLGPHELTELNSRPTWIPLANGVYDTETNEIRPHSPKHWLTHQLPFAYDPGADCPRWKEFLLQVMLRSDGTPCQEWIDALQEWFGYCLVPDNRYQMSMVWVGEGQNGKGVATRVLQELVGSAQCCSVPIEQLHDPYYRASLHGKLVGFVNEPDPRAMLKNGSYFKALTGKDAIDGRRPTEKVFFFVPTVRLVISCNALLTTRDLSHGYFRRLVIIEWRYQVPDGQQDTSLDDRLSEELPGIFNWALEGLRRFRERGSRLDRLPESEALLKDYKLSEDSFAQFLDDECERGPELKWVTGDLYAAYVAYCQENGFPRAQSSTSVGTRLTKMGCEKGNTVIDGVTVRYRRGIALRENSPYANVRAGQGRRRRSKREFDPGEPPPELPAQREIVY
ncbi:MAG: phage/plasmid primase, P4 family [Armatimonadota bacterium]